MANEKGVWRTIGGRRVFIKEGQDLASAMKESGKFKSAKKFSKREELKKDIAHQVTEAEKNGNTAHAEIGKRELERLNNEEKEQAVKDYENGKISAEDVLNKFYGQEDKMKEAFEKMGYTAPTKENIDKANKRHEEFMSGLKSKEEKKNSNDKFLEKAKALDDRDKGKISEEEYFKRLNDIDGLDNEKEKAKVKENLDRLGVERPEFLKDKEDSKNSNKDFKELVKTDDTYKAVADWENGTKGYQETLERFGGDKEKMNARFKEMGYNPPKDYGEDELLERVSRHHSYEAKQLGISEEKLSKMKSQEGLKKEGLLAPIDPYKPEDEAKKILGLDSNDTDLNKFNDKARAKFGKIDYYGNGRKSNAVEIEMELKDGNFSAMGFIKNARGTDSVSGGQNIDEIADLMKDNKDVQEIHSLWKKYHLNQMHAGTEKQEEALEKFKSERKAIAEQMNKGKTYDWQKVDERDYEVTKKLLENHNLLEDDGYKYGTSWLKREIPDDDKRRIISLINKYNGKGADSTSGENSNKTTNQSMNDTLRNAFNDYRKKHKNSNMSFTEFMRINKK